MMPQDWLLWGFVSKPSQTHLGPCPLTVAETQLEAQAGVEPTHGPFLAQVLDAIVYPDLPEWLVVGFAVAVCVAILLSRRRPVAESLALRDRARRESPPPTSGPTRLARQNSAEYSRSPLSQVHSPRAASSSPPGTPAPS